MLPSTYSTVLHRTLVNFWRHQKLTHTTLYDTKEIMVLPRRDVLANTGIAETITDGSIIVIAVWLVNTSHHRVFEGDDYFSSHYSGHDGGNFKRGNVINV